MDVKSAAAQKLLFEAEIVAAPIKGVFNPISKAISDMNKAYATETTNTLRVISQEKIELNVDVSNPAQEIKKIKEMAEKVWTERKGEKEGFVALSPQSQGRFNALIRQLDNLSQEELLDPTRAREIFALSEAIKKTVKETQDLNLWGYEEISRSTAKTEHVTNMLYKTYQDINAEMIAAVAEAQEMETTEGKLSEAMLRRLLKATDLYEKNKGVMKEILNLSGKRSGLLDKEKKLGDEFLKKGVLELARNDKLLKIGKALDALKMTWLKNLISVEGRATTVLGGFADAFLEMGTTQERFHTINYRAYGSMRDMNNMVVATSLRTGMLREETKKAYEALAAVGAPKAALETLVDENLNFTRVTGTSNDAVARFQRTMFTVTGGAVAAGSAMGSRPAASWTFSGRPTRMPISRILKR